MSNYFSLYLRILKILLKSKFILQKPKKKKYLIFDGRNKNLLFKYIKNNDSSVIYTRGEEINLYVLTLSFFEFGFRNIHFNYIKTYIKFTDPKFCITLNHPKVYFYKIKNLYKNIKTIAFQNGHTFIFNSKFIKQLKKEKKANLEADYIFSINNFFTKKLFRKYIKGQYIEVGSFKNNFYKKKKTFQKRKSIAFVSQWRTPESYDNQREPSILSFFNTAKKILPKLENYVIKKNLKLEILGSEWDSREKVFYNKILKSKRWIFKNRSLKNQSYYSTDKVKFVVFVDSSLGFESLARGNKTVSFYFLDKTIKTKKFNHFGFDFLKNKGNFWTNENTDQEFDRIISYVEKISNKQWKKENSSIINKIMQYDHGNHKFKKLLS
jgi:surface carbohydrate biosynthesis protein